MALYSVVFLGTTPIGSPLVGWIAQAAGPRMAFYVAGGATVIGGLAALWALRRSVLVGRLRDAADDWKTPPGCLRTHKPGGTLNGVPHQWRRSR